MKCLLKRIRGKGRGWVFTPRDLLDIAPRNTVDQILFRLVKQGLIRRLDRGIYDFPVQHDQLGPLAPHPDQIAHALASLTADRIQPTGAMLANQWGLDTQVPAKATYLTSGKGKQRQITGYTITLRQSKLVRLFAAKPKLCQLLLVLQHLGKHYLDAPTIKKCRQHLTDKDKRQLVHAKQRAPHWMRPVIDQMIGVS